MLLIANPGDREFIEYGPLHTIRIVDKLAMDDYFLPKKVRSNDTSYITKMY